MKQLRTKEITELEGQTTLDLFELDFKKYNYSTTDSLIIEYVSILILKYGVQGLRTLASIQFSTAVSLFRQVDIFLTADKFLKSLFIAESLPTDLRSR